MSATVQMPRHFKADFDAVCRANKCPPDEVKEMTDQARLHPDDAIRSFAHNALIIRGGWDGKYAGVAA